MLKHYKGRMTPWIACFLIVLGSWSEALKVSKEDKNRIKKALNPVRARVTNIIDAKKNHCNEFSDKILEKNEEFYPEMTGIRSF